MRKVIVMLSLGVLFAGSAMAADGPGREEKASLRQAGNKDNDGYIKGIDEVNIREIISESTGNMARELDLNEKQERDLQSLNMKHTQKIKDLLKDDRYSRGIFELDQREMKKIDRKEQAQIEALDNQYESELKEILTSAQYRKYKRNRR